MISVVPVFIGDGIPLIARRHRQVPLRLRTTKAFPDGVVQLHYSCSAAVITPASVVRRDLSPPSSWNASRTNAPS